MIEFCSSLWSAFVPFSWAGGPGHRTQTFATFQEQFQGEEEVYVGRRPVSQLDIGELTLRELAFPTEVIPGEKATDTIHFPAPCLGLGACSLHFRKGTEKLGFQNFSGENSLQS